MTYEAALTRRYRNREEAYGYLASRGFLFMPTGWENGRWAATLDLDGSGVTVSIWLRAAEAA